MQFHLRHAIRLGLLAGTWFLVGCLADPANDAAHQRQRDQMASAGIALLTDACIYRQSPPLQHNYYPLAESLRAANAIQTNLAKQLASFGYRIAVQAIPFVCGGLALDAPRGVYTAEAVDKNPVRATTFPVVVPAALQKDATLQAAYWQLMKLATEATTTTDSSLRRLHERPSPHQVDLLRRHLHSSQVMVALGRGASISAGMKAADTVIGFFVAGQIGGGGCSLSDKDCGLSDTGHDGFRISVVLIDLDQPELIWRGTDTDITGHQGTFDNNDPLDPQIYTDLAWAPKLLNHFPGATRRQ